MRFIVAVNYTNGDSKQSGKGHFGIHSTTFITLAPIPVYWCWTEQNKYCIAERSFL